MRILPYPRKFFGSRDAVEVRDWSQQELADFYRAHRLLVQNGVGIGMDRGVTDAGDPWMAFFDVSTQDVFMHVARIGRECVLICDQLDLRITCGTVSELIASFESEVCRIVSVRQQRSGNVILHPAARIIMSISAVFLLFKLENGSTAHAKGADAEFGAGHDSSRKQEVSLTGRVQTVIARIYDMVDTPAAVASLAGVLLSLEIASLHSRSASPEHAEAKLLGGHDAHESVVVFADTAAEMAAEAPQEKTQIISESHASVRELVVVPIPVEVEADLASASSSQQNVLVFTTVERADIPVLTGNSAGETIVVAAATQSAPISSDEGKSTDKSLDASETLAARALEVIMDVATASEKTPQDASVGEITLSMLETLIPDLGSAEQAWLTGDELRDALLYFSSAFGGYEFEVTGMYFLMEQNNASSMKNSELGVWQNFMEDGSQIIIIGHVDVIDTAGTMFG